VILGVLDHVDLLPDPPARHVQACWSSSFSSFSSSFLVVLLLLLLPLTRRVPAYGGMVLG
jgi:hypothetical protein